MKKILSVILVILLMITAAIVPSFAKAIDYDGNEMVTLKTSSGKTVLQEPSTSHAEEILYYNQGGANPEYIPSSTVTSETVIKPGEKFTLKNVSGHELAITVKATPYTYTGENYACGLYDGETTNTSYHLLDDGRWGAVYAGYLDGFNLKNGQSRTFVLDEFIGNNELVQEVTEGAYFHLEVWTVNQDSDFYDLCEFYYWVKRTGDLTPVKPAEPEKPAQSESASDMLTVNTATEWLGDEGYVYDFKVKNTTNKKMTGYYAVLSYQPEKWLDRRGNEHYTAEIHIFEVNLAPGETMSNKLVSTHHMSGAENLWVSFDNKAELQSFVKQSGISETVSHYSDKYFFHGTGGEAILKNIFDVEFTPAK